MKSKIPFKNTPTAEERAAAVAFLQMCQILAAYVDCMGTPNIGREMWDHAVGIRMRCRQVEETYRRSMRKQGFSQEEIEEYMEATYDANSLLFQGMKMLTTPNNIDERIKMTALLEAYLNGEVEYTND